MPEREERVFLESIPTQLGIDVEIEGDEIIISQAVDGIGVQTVVVHRENLDSLLGILELAGHTWEDDPD